ncbi:Ribonuclease Z, mitochondrial [Frankliniella fusca]|uniref:ribonuclease Z n=1 Tax=Frankliniella fusca TaxID=407009 RepID=A0AAE1HYJ3_9NEOP|nr:Ribonuclease Z, mitochondrial [Frankliniella fusca]
MISKTNKSYWRINPIMSLCRKNIFSGRILPPCSTRYISAMVQCERDSDRMRIMYEKRSAPVGDMHVKVVGSGSLNISKSVLLRVRNERMFFNCGQSGEHSGKAILNKGLCNNLFITHLDWIKIGGIISLIYKASTSRREEIIFHGPSGLDVFVRAAENFLRLNSNLKVTVSKSCDVETDILKIKSVSLHQKNRVTLNPTKIDTTFVRGRLAKKAIHQVESILDKVPESIVDLNTAYSYIVEIKSKSAWVLSECVKRGVKPGENMKKLWRGETVILDDGSVVKPEDVIQHENFPTVIILDVPSEGYLDDLLQKDEYKDLYSKVNPCVIVHFSPPSVMKDERYISWMQRFSTFTSHMIVNESNRWETPQKIQNRQEVCRLISPQFFPELISNRKRAADQFYVVHDEFQTEEPPIIISEENYDCWLQEWKCIPEDINFIQSWPGTILNLNSLNPVRDFQPLVISEEPAKNRQVFKCSYKTSPENPKITFLGTGSQSNSAYRNSSGILLELSSEYSILLDCGDGMMHQLACLYSAQKREKVISSLRCIFVSHTHADHHAGLIGLLCAIRNKTIQHQQENKLILLIPPVFIEWLETYHNKFEPILDNVILISLADLVARKGNTGKEINSLFRRHLGMKQITSCIARHSAFSYCVTFQHNSGWKISYSGDTGFCRDFAQIGKNSDLLIHEATFGTGLNLLAKQSKHSTTEDAIDLGKEMCAKQVILTHFSQRYPHITRLKDLENTRNVSVAFDFLQCHLKDFQYLPKLNKSYEKVFAAYESENLEEHERLTTRESLLSGISNAKYPPNEIEDLI